MSKINTTHVFTSESVSEGHPDKVCDRISDAILDAALIQDPDSRVAVETLAATNLIVLAGEITTRAKLNYQRIALDTIREIGYDNPALGFSAQEAQVFVALHGQSPDISQGVSAGEGLFKEQGAGDQGIMFGYATSETPALLPATLWYSHRIVKEFARLRKEEKAKYPFLRPDSKSQVSIRYENGKPIAVESIVVSHQHGPELKPGELEELTRQVVKTVIPAELLQEEITYFVNPTGKFEIGGPNGDVGLTGRKIIVDTYGGVGSHGGGAFSGKDPSKVDRSAAYLARYIARNIVAAGLAEKCEVQLAYAIGVAEPLSINIDTYGTGTLTDDAALVPLIRELFPLKPAEIIQHFELKNPTKNGWRYQDTSAYGHFGRPSFPWEKDDKAEELKRKSKSLR